MKTKKNKPEIETEKIETETTTENLTTIETPEILNIPLDIPQDEIFTVEPEPEPEPEKKTRKPRKTKEPQIQNFDSNEFTEPEPETNEQTESSLYSVFPSGGLVTVLDKVMSNLIPLAFNNLLNTKLTKEQFTLDASEKKAISPVLDECAKTIPLNFKNPFINLTIILVGIYGAKGIGLVNFDKLGNQSKEKKVRRTKAQIAADNLNS